VIATAVSEYCTCTAGVCENPTKTMHMLNWGLIITPSWI